MSNITGTDGNGIPEGNADDLTSAFAKFAMDNGWGSAEIDAAIRGLERVKVS
eukprot:CAMPEP_0172628308 /NCGR_PEP_ID=MMETSP1068-20121228/161017_1 /TAXON_ID=35684 /ORGANISM="Pseudopedinella elastica, Strain CCMP716" /LENGTH=51 /DNA_ID=CAMNT_0013438461 /DNA_START=83 /DNA_END=235 /DNA_ORIENTATION=+